MPKMVFIDHKALRTLNKEHMRSHASSLGSWNRAKKKKTWGYCLAHLPLAAHTRANCFDENMKWQSTCGQGLCESQQHSCYAHKKQHECSELGLEVCTLAKVCQEKDDCRNFKNARFAGNIATYISQHRFVRFGRLGAGGSLSSPLSCLLLGGFVLVFTLGLQKQKTKISHH